MPLNGAFAISAHLPIEIALISIALSAPFVKFAQSLSTKAVKATYLSKLASKHRARPTRVKISSVSSRTILVFICAGASVVSDICGYKLTVINPFTATRPIKVQNLKSLSLFGFFFALASDGIFIETHAVESRFVTGPENKTHSEKEGEKEEEEEDVFN